MDPVPREVFQDREGEDGILAVDPVVRRSRHAEGASEDSVIQRFRKRKHEAITCAGGGHPTLLPARHIDRLQVRWTDTQLLCKDPGQRIAFSVWPRVVDDQRVRRTLAYRSAQLLVELEPTLDSTGVKEDRVALT